jgi:DNA-nicking Smr family endonuclease
MFHKMSSVPDIDLHKFFREPDKAKKIIDVAIADNLSKGNFQIRIIHGKGQGHYRKLIHSHLEKHPDVAGFTLCDPSHGGTGATWVFLSQSEPLAHGLYP